MSNGSSNTGNRWSHAELTPSFSSVSCLVMGWLTEIGRFLIAWNRRLVAPMDSNLAAMDGLSSTSAFRYAPPMGWLRSFVPLVNCFLSKGSCPNCGRTTLR